MSQSDRKAMTKMKFTICILNFVEDRISKQTSWQIGCFVFLFLWLSFTAALSQNSGPKIEVIYPKDGQELTAYDSTFILGNVTSGSDLKINGYPVKVYPNGAFLAFLPIQGGDFQFELIASEHKGVTTKVVLVKVLERLKMTPADSFRIEPKGKTPNLDLVLTAGDWLQLGFRGTPNCQAMFKIEGLTDWMDMAESQTRAIAFESGTVFSDTEAIDTSSGKGIYSGLYRIGDEDRIDSARIYFRLVKSVSAPSESLRNYLAFPEIYQRLCPDSAKLSICVADSTEGTVTILPSEILQVVELVDTSQIIPRTGPGLLYWYLFQSSGTKAVTNGKVGKWVRLKLTETEEAWIEEEKVKYLPWGTPPPYSKVGHIRTRQTEKGVKIVFSMSERLPFRVKQQNDPPSLLLDIFYAASDVNIIRYETQDPIIDEITWSQLANDHFQAQIYVRQKQQWGYEAYYEGENLVLEIKSKPEWTEKLRGLTITVDAGHSADPGAIGPTGLIEKDANLAIAKKLKQVLEKSGAKVVMTRNGMENVPLYERPKIAQGVGTDIFISVHNNAHPDGVNPFTNTGTSVYYYHPHSKRLAEAVHRQLLKDLQIGDQGLYQGNFAVLRPSGYLSILVECAFIIQPEQEILLKDQDFQERIARGIYKGLSRLLEEFK